MKCPPNITPDPNGEGKPVVIALVASEVAFPPGDLESVIITELVLEAEMNRRAAVITDVLAGIIEHPAPPRHWGLNE